jgi:hypothetical protein
MPCIECYFFPVCFYFISAGSRVDVSNESDVKIDNTEDQYLSIDVQVKKKNPGYLYFGYQQNKASSPPSEPMVSKYFKTYYFCNI